jgi:molybdopterin/thiamine biosynthesis adenylyltransferase
MYKHQIGAKPTKLTHINARQLLEAPDLVVDCTDNFEARRVIQSYVEPGTVDCLHGCLSADGTLVRVIWTEHFVPDAEGAEGEATCEDGENLPFHALAAAMMAQIAQHFLKTGVKESYQMTPYKVLRVA